MSDRTIVENFRDREGYRCGYCGSTDSNYSHGMWAHQLTCQDYQDLIDRGFRRSGKYCYKPDLNKMCCPCYPIRCEALHFRATKSQKKVLKRMTKYLTVPQAAAGKLSCSTSEDTAMHCKDAENDRCQSSVESLSDKLQGGLINTDKLHQVRPSEPRNTATTGKQCKDEGPSSTASSTNQVKTCSNVTPGKGPDPSKPPCRKAKDIRRQRRQQKKKNGVEESIPRPKNEAKSLEQFLMEHRPDVNTAHKMEVRLVRSDMNNPEFFRTHQESYEVYKKYQTGIHKDKPDECTEKQYRRFLCSSPLVHSKEAGAPHMGYGSFHQQYWLDGRIIAVGVLDILPSCISSVYLFYDPAYSHLSLGVYSALREVYLVQCLHKESASVQYYYMGFYIHSCPKMRYKGNYYPSYLVCPETYRWVPIEQCRPKLDANKYSRLDQTGPDFPSTDINKMLILYERQAMPYLIYRAIKQNEDDEGDDNDDTDEIQELADMVGPAVAQRMLLFRS
ncbi:arginyl-tRNA--protein transferase 1 isoform X3 [Nematostella vectensis]|uniref:arginyl-tRNA--protein transferase 1 isoform X3 n=1 Tax=Nematostella vectensis TaxID=45351 RepID=UPI00207733B3|nr:arginyl-tRNA--protein transferase 1 isoform X3 [Nematostella vectensis]